MIRIFNILLCFSVFTAFGQLVLPYNFVPNPSFETYSNCPDAFGQMDRCAKWEQATGGTSDYLNACYSGGGNVGVPNNYMGYQEAHTGDAYAGIICYSTESIFDYKEYIHVVLKKPLLEGYTYKISFYCSLAEGVSTWAIQDIGATLSPGNLGVSIQYGSITKVLPPVKPDNIIQTTTDWVLVEGFVTLKEPMTYLTIGNFTPSDETEAVKINPGGQGFAYYYIDDVAVQLVLSEDIFGSNPGNGYDPNSPSPNAYSEDGYLYDVVIPNVITTNGDQVNDDFFIKYYGYIKSNISILDRWGRPEYYSDNFFIDSWDAEGKNDGVYYYILNMMRIDGEFDQFTGSITVINS